ncbi:methyl-accepting chemotaxis protein, partial [Motilibacter aurantiacus]|uniref:methyl-accepting chemotaxis protein n=1 Tax=Motilibacter aurantiacus TaxID=2714955 RepID=UPI001409686E|nr:methyl-accepting chemotaxis protein [Motilibacter aurantiacus]
MNRPTASIGAKLAAVAGVGVLATVTVGAVAVLGAERIDDEQTTLSAIRDARANVLRLDTRASELKVDAYKAMVRPDPAAQKSELADDVATAQELLGKLPPVEVLPAVTGERVAALESAYTGYFTQIEAVVDGAITDGAAARASYEDVQTANDATDAAVGAALEAMDVDVAAAEARVDSAVAGVKRTTTITFLLAVVLLGGIAWRVARGIIRPLRQTVQALDALAQGDLTGTVSTRSNDEIGRMAAALGRAQDGIRGLVRSVSASADGLAGAASQLSGAAGQISAAAADSSAQAESVAGTVEQVSRGVHTVAAGSEEMGASIREIAHNTNEAARVAAEAVSVAETTNATVSSLGDSSREIGDVVKVITSIAEQTNL